MPKPVVHHLHISCGVPLDFLVKMTYYDQVYFNDRLNIFKVSKTGINDEGYI
jgi:hypothetical protein